MNREPVALAREAMATRFELLLYGDDPVRLRAAGEEALREVEWADAELSRYRPGSAVFWLNARAGGEPVPVDPRVSRLLAQCAELSARTDGAFDPSVGPLLRAWGFLDHQPGRPDAQELARARRLVGMSRLELDEASGTARLAEPGMELDMGAVGKGYALDRAASVLREHGIRRALLHGGTSSVHALGEGEDGDPWRIGWRVPGHEPEIEPLCLEAPALSVSAPHGKAFVTDGESYGHVLDPRGGEPTRGMLSAVVSGPSSTLCDALSTALLVLGEPGALRLAARFPGYAFRVASC